VNGIGWLKRLVRQEDGLQAGSIEMVEQDGRLNHSFVAPEKAKNSLRQGVLGMLAQAV